MQFNNWTCRQSHYGMTRRAIWRRNNQPCSRISPTEPQTRAGLLKDKIHKNGVYSFPPLDQVRIKKWFGYGQKCVLELVETAMERVYRFMRRNATNPELYAGFRTWIISRFTTFPVGPRTCENDRVRMELGHECGPWQHGGDIFAKGCRQGVI